MAVTHSSAVRNAIADLVVDSVDSSGLLCFRNAADGIVATLPLAATAFTAAATGKATALAIASDTNAAGGTVTKATLQTAASVIKVTCSVSTAGGGGDIILNSCIISAGQTVSVTSLTYEAPA